MSEKKELSIEEQIIAQMLSPKSVEVDGQKVEQFSPEDWERAVRLAASIKAGKSKRLGIRIGKMVHGGAE